MVRDVDAAGSQALGAEERFGSSSTYSSAAIETPSSSSISAGQRASTSNNR